MPEEGEFVGSNYSGPSDFLKKPKYIEVLEKIYKGEIKLGIREYIILPPEDLSVALVAYFLSDAGNYINPATTFIDRLTASDMVNEFEQMGPLVEQLFGQPYAQLAENAANIMQKHTALAPYIIDIIRIASPTPGNSIYIVKTMYSTFIIREYMGAFELNLVQAIAQLGLALQNHFKLVAFDDITTDAGYSIIGIQSKPELFRSEKFYKEVALSLFHKPLSPTRVNVETKGIEFIETPSPQVKYEYEIEVYYRTIDVKGVKAVNAIVPKDILNKYFEAFIMSNYTMHPITLGEE